MSQDLVTLSMAKLKLQLPIMSLGVIKDLIFRIALWKRNNGDKVPEYVFGDMLRKEAVIIRELSKRKMTSGQDFRQWLSALQVGLTKDGRISPVRKIAKQKRGDD